MNLRGGAFSDKQEKPLAWQAAGAEKSRAQWTESAVEEEFIGVRTRAHTGCRHREKDSLLGALESKISSLLEDWVFCFVCFVSLISEAFFPLIWGWLV